ncbi:hypothetical protein BJX70DRAFT_390580 [Aspergillus crustosus]
MPTFQMNNFKPWAPPHQRPFAQHKSSNLCSIRTQNPPRSTLTPLKHDLPARPLVKVCVSTNTGIWLSSLPLSSQSQPRDITALEPHTYSETPKHNKNPNNLAPYFRDPPSLVLGDSGEANLLSPSVSGLDDSLEEFFRLPVIQDNTPINPVILTNYSSSQISTSPNISYANDAHRQTHKRPRAYSISPSKDNFFTTIRSYFISLPLNDRLQFLSWLFEGALQHCMSDLLLIVCKDRDARGSLLLKLRQDKKQPWAEVTRLFLEKYPGRTQGMIQVYWSTTLSKKDD